MTQHLRTTPVRSCKSTQGTLYRTVCGRWVISAKANGPGGVTCRACKPMTTVGPRVKERLKIDRRTTERVDRKGLVHAAADNSLGQECV